MYIVGLGFRGKIQLRAFHISVSFHKDTMYIPIESIIIFCGIQSVIALVVSKKFFFN